MKIASTGHSGPHTPTINACIWIDEELIKRFHGFSSVTVCVAGILHVRAENLPMSGYITPTRNANICTIAIGHISRILL